MNIREQAFNEIVSDPILWRAWSNARDEFDRSNMLIEQAYLLGVKHVKQASEVAVK